MSVPQDFVQGTIKNTSPLNIGIVGGSISGLYAALLLQREGHYVRIFEGTDRVGGRVRTHYFSQEDNQYFEAGAMRIPNSPFHTIVFQLIDYLTTSDLPKEMQVALIKYILNAPGNSLYINGVTSPGYNVSSTTPSEIQWDVPQEYANQTAKDLMLSAIGPFLAELKENFQAAFNRIVAKYDSYSFRYYCSSVMGWPETVIDFVETVTSQTNQFALSVTELVMQNMDFDETDWKTIDKGMSRLPQAMAWLVGHNNITFGARVTGIEEEEDGRTTIVASGYNGTVKAKFDRVIVAIPPAALKMIVDRPRWSVEKEMAIRSMHFEALYKMGMRFKTRFWEQVQPKSCDGGQSTTDLPIRWIVFPSNGIGGDGPGVLLVYAWMTDAATWLPLTPIERRSLALHCIAQLYQGQVDKHGNEIDVYDLLMETSDAIWSEATATGDAMFLPSQFASRFQVARAPEGNVYFAGEHLSYHHTWISGAADSALKTVRDLLNDQTILPLGTPRTGLPTPSRPGAPIGQGAVADVDFEFIPHNPMFLGDGSIWRPVIGRPGPPFSNQSAKKPGMPKDLGMSGLHVLGADVAHLKGPNSVEMS
ncbi:hypothetical protein OF83DRAFT_1169691 [Amylostereum chailletii]|nr:hypothetical protein OF83DRAFT_1169691 [Amylostereum chailletii]